MKTYKHGGFLSDMLSAPDVKLLYSIKAVKKKTFYTNFSSHRANLTLNAVQYRVQTRRFYNRDSSASYERRSSASSFRGITVGCVSYVHGKRVRDKKLPCFVCRTAVNWLARHLERQHSDNFLVAEVLAKSGIQRKNGLKRLKNLGAFQHNIDILKKGHGELVIVRRTTGKHSARSYLPCSKCYGFYYKYDLWRHSCPCDDSSINKDKSKRSSVVESSRSILDGAMDTECKDKNLKRYVLCCMRKDKSYDVVRRDELILKFGSHLLKRIGVKGRRRIAAKLRLLAKLLCMLRKLSDKVEKPLTFFLDGPYYDLVAEAAEKLSNAGFDEHGAASSISALSASVLCDSGTTAGAA